MKLRLPTIPNRLFAIVTIALFGATMLILSGCQVTVGLVPLIG